MLLLFVAASAALVLTGLLLRAATPQSLRPFARHALAMLLATATFVIAASLVGLAALAGDWLYMSLFLAWILVLGWPRLKPVERLMRIAVLFMAVAIAIAQAGPRG
jgi:hypothetical protein